MENPLPSPDRTLADLEAAESRSDVLTALALAVADDTADEVPTLKDLVEWWPNCPSDARKEARQGFLELARAEDPDTEDRVGIDFIADMDELLCRLPRISAEEGSSPGLLENCDVLELTKRWLPHRPVRHPLSPIIEAWQRRPIELRSRNDRPDPLLPRLLLSSKTDSPREAPDLFTSYRPRGWLPDLAPGEVEGDAEVVSCLPLSLWDLCSETERLRRPGGAPLPARIFVDVLMDVKRERWPEAASRGVLLPAERFGDFLARLYLPGTSGRIRWDRRQLPAMLRAFELLESPDTRIAWYDSITETGGARRMVVPVDVPRDGRMRDFVRFAVFMPPGASRGPLIDRPNLLQAGVRSAPAWRLVLNLASSWNRVGSLRRPVRRGAHWQQVRTWERYNVVSDSVLAAMAFPLHSAPLSRSTERSRKQRAKSALEYLVSIKYAEILPAYSGRKIRPGENWAGWGHRRSSPAVP